MDAKRVGHEDRISELPVHIIHHILCQTEITPKEAARTCVLSKRWYNFWTSRPNLVLRQKRDYSNFSCMSREEFVKYVDRSLEEFVNLVDQSLKPHVEQNLRLEEFSITCLPNYVPHQELASHHVNRWIDLVVKLNVKMLEIHPPNSWYSLPDAIYAAKELTTLKLSRFKFEFDSSTTNIITFCNLKNLLLWRVHILGDQLQRVILSCPFIGNITLVDCEGINKLHVFGLVHLQNLVVSSCELESVIVQAPKLRLFGLSKHIDDSLVPRNVAILDAYNTLEILELNCSSITDQQFQDIFSKHSNILELNLTSCYELKNIEIVSEKLNKLTLSKLENLKQVKIQAPNLLEFEFKGDKIPSNLPHFVQNFNYSKGLILAIFCNKNKAIFIYEDPKEIVIPPSEDEVTILIRPIMHLESFIDELMDMYPKTMSILPTTNSKVFQVLSTLIGCSDNTKIKCFYSWQRQLKEVSTHTIEKEMYSVWYWWLKSPSLFDQATTFMFKWEDESIIHSKPWRSSIRVVG